MQRNAKSGQNYVLRTEGMYFAVSKTLEWPSMYILARSSAVMANCTLQRPQKT